MQFKVFGGLVLLYEGLPLLRQTVVKRDRYYLNTQIRLSKFNKVELKTESLIAVNAIEITVIFACDNSLANASVISP